MPKFPEVSVPAGAIPASIFARLLGRLRSYQGEVYPFHLGDTHLEVTPEARLDTLRWDEKNAGNLYRYSSPAGDEALIEAVLAKLEARNGLRATREQLQITSGATHAFSCAARALFNPGDEVLLLSPFWPLIRGQVLSVGARPVEVPFSLELYKDPGANPKDLIEPFITEKTVAIYLINPNNPDGKVLTESQLRAVGEVALRHDLWVLSDEVYEDFLFHDDGEQRKHVSMATLPDMADRTLTAFSFSKSYALAGLRVGYIVGPPRALAPLSRMSNHSIFSVPRTTQRVALAALTHGTGFLHSAREQYLLARDAAMTVIEKMSLPCYRPEGATYVFVDLAEHLGDKETAVDLLERLAGDGILLAPGGAFGRDYESWARICYSAMPLDKLRDGLEKMADLLAGSLKSGCD